MASGVTMLSFHKLHDYAEMGEAALSGMLFSNHSYGTFAGWEAKTTKWRGPYNFSGEDPEFGSYTEDTKVLDALAYLAPHYISVWASGNEVTDDGRIKPDLVANGESILTLGSENANSTSFGSGNGTSYSGPGVTGTLALL